MGRRSRTKGRRFEQWAASFLAALWPGCRRMFGQARAGGDAPDVDGPRLPFWVEAKNEQCPSVWAAYAQAKRDTDGRPVLVIAKRTRGPTLCVMDVDAWLELAELAEHGRKLRSGQLVVMDRELEQALREAPFEQMQQAKEAEDLL